MVRRGVACRSGGTGDGCWRYCRSDDGGGGAVGELSNGEGMIIG